MLTPNKGTPEKDAMLHVASVFGGTSTYEGVNLETLYETA
jgi:hypothetical protein